MPETMTEAKTLKDNVARPLGQIPSGCFVVTAMDGERCTAVLASWVQQAGFAPPALTVAIKKEGRPIREIIDRTGQFIVNTLGDQPTGLLKHFAKGFGLDAPAFEGLPTEDHEAGVILNDALGWLACRLTNTVDAGDHVVLIAHVIDGRKLADGKPHIHLRTNGFSY